jgi:RNA polymerase sigma factor (sigma-70 family)
MTPKLKESSLLFDEELKSFQPDLVRIIAKFRHSNHHLEIDEILSDVNLMLIKKKDDILESFDTEFTSVDFRKIAYAYARNSVGWIQGRLNRNSYISKRVNNSHETEEGPISTFELACNTIGEGEEPAPYSLDSNNKCAYVLKMIKEYCHILTDQEYRVLCLKEKGKNLRQIAKVLGVTHQAISITEGNIREKIKSYLNVDPFSDNSHAKVREGVESVNSLFSSYPKFSNQDRKDLKSLLVNSFKKYTALEIAARFKGGKFSHQQIVSFCSKKGLSLYLKKRSRNSYSRTEEFKIIKMINGGCYLENLIMELGRDRKSVSSKITHLMRAKVIEARPSSSFASLSLKDKRTLRWFRQGLSTKEVADKREISLRSAASMRGRFVVKGLLSPCTPLADRERNSRNRLIEKGNHASMGGSE